MEMLQDSLSYATEEVDRLAKVLDEQTTLLQATQDQLADREATIKTLQDQVTPTPPVHLSVPSVEVVAVGGCCCAYCCSCDCY